MNAQPTNQARIANKTFPRFLFSTVSIAMTVVNLSSGCGEPVAKKEENKPEPIFNRKNQEIAEAEPNAQEADLSAKGPSVALGSYGFAISQISKMKIKHALEMYRAVEGDYPKDFDTFMSEIIKKNGIELPVLPGGRQYQYDVDKHELIVVEKADAKDLTE